MDNAAKQRLFEIDVVRPTGNHSKARETKSGKIVSRWITYATSCEEAEARFVQMVADDRGPEGLIDSWHPVEGDFLSSMPVEFEFPCYQVL